MAEATKLQFYLRFLLSRRIISGFVSLGNGTLVVRVSISWSLFAVLSCGTVWFCTNCWVSSALWRLRSLVRYLSWETTCFLSSSRMLWWFLSAFVASCGFSSPWRSHPHHWFQLRRLSYLLYSWRLIASHSTKWHQILMILGLVDRNWGHADSSHLVLRRAIYHPATVSLHQFHCSDLGNEIVLFFFLLNFWCVNLRSMSKSSGFLGSSDTLKISSQDQLIAYYRAVLLLSCCRQSMGYGDCRKVMIRPSSPTSANLVKRLFTGWLEVQ